MNYWVARISSCPLWTRLSPPTPPATALAAAEAAGMPVRRPRRPAAVSAADAAGAGPELGCAGQLERAAEAPTNYNRRDGKFALGGSVSRSVGRSVRSGRRLEFDIPGADCLRGGSIPPPGVVESRTGLFGVSSLLRVSRSVCGGVGVGGFNVPGAACLRGGSIPPPGVCLFSLLGVAGWCCRCGIGGCLSVLARASRLHSQCAVRCFR
jgi:hypothetical protein